MRLLLRWNHWNRIHFSAALLCAVVVALAVPNAARAWHGDDDWRPRHHHGHGHDGDWGGRRYFAHPPFFVPPPFGVRVYPGYYPAPYYRTPCPEHYYEDDASYPGPPAYVPVPPVSVSFGFNWAFRR